MRGEDRGRATGGAWIARLAPEDVEAVSALAREIWLAHYPGIISVAQIEYMLAGRYDPRVIAAELAHAGLWWDKLMVDDSLAGFASYFLVADGRAMKLDKVYVQARQRRRGFGGQLVARACAAARDAGCTRIELAVNRRNAGAIAAYRRCGFAVKEAVVKDIGNGFVMDDYVMERDIDG